MTTHEAARLLRAACIEIARTGASHVCGACIAAHLRAKHGPEVLDAICTALDGDLLKGSTESDCRAVAAINAIIRAARHAPAHGRDQN